MKHIHAAFVLAVLLACKQSPPAPEHYDYEVFVAGEAGTVQGVEMGGKQLEGGTKSARGTSFSIKVPAHEHAAERAFAVVVSNTCGTEKLPATLKFGLARATGVRGEDRERAQATSGKAMLTELQYSPPQVARIYLDGDGAASVKVEVGTTSLPVAQSEHDVVLGGCPTAREVKVDGKVVGTVNDKPRLVTGADGKKLEAPGTTLIDPSAKHCYEARLHIYVDRKTDTSNMARSAPKRLEGEHVYVQSIDDFLKASPTELNSLGDYPSRYEIRRCATK
jgi:hypothetical protein